MIGVIIFIWLALFSGGVDRHIGSGFGIDHSVRERVHRPVKIIKKKTIRSGVGRIK